MFKIHFITDYDLESVPNIVGVEHDVDVAGVHALVGEPPALQGQQVVKAPLCTETNLNLKTYNQCFGSVSFGLPDPDLFHAEYGSGLQKSRNINTKIN